MGLDRRDVLLIASMYFNRCSTDFVTWWFSGCSLKNITVQLVLFTTKKKEEYIAVGVCLLKNKGRAREETWRFREDERRNVSQKEETTKR